MKTNLKFFFAALAFGILFTGCDKSDNPITGGKYSEFTIKGVTRYGDLTDDKTLKALTIPCQDNSTFRMYYSDSAARYGLPTVPGRLNIVSYLKAGHLAYNEVYIEVTTSAVDTYLSVGTSGETFGYFGFDQHNQLGSVVLQHFTSTPQSDTTTVHAVL